MLGAREAAWLRLGIVFYAMLGLAYALMWLLVTLIEKAREERALRQARTTQARERKGLWDSVKYLLLVLSLFALASAAMFFAYRHYNLQDMCVVLCVERGAVALMRVRACAEVSTCRAILRN